MYPEKAGEVAPWGAWNDGGDGLLNGKQVTAVILAAGLGKRMRSRLIKVLHPLMGRPMVAHVLDAVRKAGVERIVAVVGYQEERVRELLGPGVEYVRQEEQLGTGHALRQTAPLLAHDPGHVLALYGDTPLLTAGEIERLLAEHLGSGTAATVLTAVMDDPTGYGRVIRNAHGGFEAIVEEADAGEGELAVGEVNTGIYCFRAADLFPALARLGRDNAQGEYYLTDVPQLLKADGKRVAVVAAADSRAVLGVNDRWQLAAVSEHMRLGYLEELALAGVTVVAPALTFVDRSVTVGIDTVLLPMTVLETGTSVGDGCVIGPSTTIRGSQVGAECKVAYSVVEECVLGQGVVVGPFAHLRPGCEIGDRVKVGNFAEIKNSQLGPGSKVPHHSYIGDASLGSEVNIGAGTVTVNYDGHKKHRTEIADRAFVGCNSNLIAPVTVGPRAYIAAGSTINRNVPAGALAIARSRQDNREGWADRWRPHG